MNAPFQSRAAAKGKQLDVARGNWSTRVAPFAAVALVAIPLVAWWPAEFSNVDEYLFRPFGREWTSSLAARISEDWQIGRFRPLYWVIQGTVALLSGDSPALLRVWRVLAAGWALLLFFRVAAGCGARGLSVGTGAVLTFLSVPALAAYLASGPAEAIGLPVLLAQTVIAQARPGGTKKLLQLGGLGLAACMMKESFVVWTAPLIALAFLHDPRCRRGGRVIGALALVAQCAPAILALSSAPPEFSYSVSRIGSEPLLAYLRGFVGSIAVVVALALGGIFVVLRDMVRKWPVRPPAGIAVVVVVFVCNTAVTVAARWGSNHYALPMVVSCGWLGVIAFDRLQDRIHRRVLTLVCAALVFAFVGRAGLEARNAHLQTMLDARLRMLARAASAEGGVLGFVWPGSHIESVIGTVEHLRLDGLSISSYVQVCAPNALGSLVDVLLRRHGISRVNALSPDIPVVWASACGGARPRSDVLLCHLVAPRRRTKWLPWSCEWASEGASLTGSRGSGSSGI